LAGGVNLYAYAGNNPTSFSDPFGLKVCYQGAQREGVCDDKDAKRLWDETYKHGNAKLRAAMDGLVNSSRTYGLRFGKPSATAVLGRPGVFVQRRFGEAGTPTKAYDGGPITIDTKDINKNLNINDARVVLAHEVGHFYGDGVSEDDAIKNYENPFRDGLGFPRRGKYADPYPKLPPPGGVRFP
jgi:hypothetical protein